MTFQAHKQKIASKLAHTIGTMKRLKYFLPTYVMKTLYNSLITPHLTYGILLWGKNLKRINKLQKWAIRTMVNGKYNQHTDPILKKHNLLKVNDIQRVSAIKFYYKYQRNELPLYFDGIFKPTPINHKYNTRNKGKNNPSPSTISASQSPTYYIPKLIENIDESIKSTFGTRSIQSVTKNAKRSFINKYNDSCQIVNCYICNNTN